MDNRRDGNLEERKRIARQHKLKKGEERKIR